ncbi:MAG: cytochrome ubiquinol oxidase subunit I [Myxococcales bacterium]|jgi:cytochrome bd-type quinol oxidase subunit 1
MNPTAFIEVPIIGNRWAVGSVFLLHVGIVAFVIGAATMAPVAEWLGHRRNSERWSTLAHSLGATVVKLYAFGATWAVFALVFLFTLYPRLFGVLMGLFFWMAIVIAALWLVMSVSVYVYYETWDRLRARPRLHMAIGWTFVVSTMAFITLISGMAAFQLAPNDATSFPATLLTATWVPQVLHRHAGNLSYAGLVLAGYAGLRMLFFPKGREEKRSYYDWLGDFGVLLGVGVIFAQPLIGAWYAFAIDEASPAAFRHITTGSRAWLFLLQLALFGSVLFLANLYFAFAMERGARAQRRTARWLRLSLAGFVAFVALVLLARVPGLGALRYFGLGLFVALTVANYALYWRARRNFRWGNVGRGPPALLLALGLLTVCLLVTMGVIRSSARDPWLIYERMHQDSAQEHERRSRAP